MKKNSFVSESVFFVRGKLAFYKGRKLVTSICLHHNQVSEKHESVTKSLSTNY